MTYKYLTKLQARVISAIIIVFLIVPVSYTLVMTFVNYQLPTLLAMWGWIALACLFLVLCCGWLMIIKLEREEAEKRRSFSHV